MRKISVVTGTRAEYGILVPLFQKIQSHPKLELSLIVTGMHLSKEFGYTIKEIENDGFKITHCPLNLGVLFSRKALIPSVLSAVVCSRK